MIYSLEGTVTHLEPGFAVVSCGGVGFKCLTTVRTVQKLHTGEKALLYTQLNVREDALDLFGFADERELACFKLLIAVTGVGPKAALSILSEASPEKLALYVASGDAKALTKAQGVGMKLAQRIVLELKDKVSAEATALGLESVPVSASGNAEEAVSALMVLGYSRSEASLAAARADASAPVEEIIRAALRELAKK